MLMRRLGGAAALSVLGLCVAARAADDGTTASNDGHWWDKLVPVAFRKTEAPKEKPPASPPARPAAPTSPVASAQETDEAAYNRRNDACFQLMQIAINTGDDKLGEQAQVLQQRAWDLYMRRMAATPSRFVSDEGVLEQHYGTSGNRRVFAPTAGTRTANAREDRE
jgi:hypothetical protein